MELLAVALLKASLLLGITQLLVAALHRLSAAAKHLLLTAGLASFVIIPLLALFGPVWEVTVATTPAAAPVISAPSGVVMPLEPPVALAPSGPDFTTAAAVLWLAIALAVLARLLRSGLRLRSIIRAAAPPSARLHLLLRQARQRLAAHAPVRLLQSDRVRVPMVWGIRAGTLLLPVHAEEWTDEQLRATFIHELGHLQRRDYVSLGLMNAVAALLWFHPQVWMARRRALLEGERACDDLVVRAGERPTEYASHLLSVARLVQRREPLAALLAMSRPSQLEGRMLAILSPSTNRQTIGGKLLMISLAAFTAVLIPLTAIQIAAQPVVAPAPSTPPAVRAIVATPAVAAAPVTPVAVAAPVRAVVAPAAVVEAKPAAAVPADVQPVEAVPAVAAVPAVGTASDVAAVPAVNPTPVIAPTPAVEPVPVVAPVEPMAVRVLSRDQIAARPFHVVASIEARSYTLKLNRPVNTGDPSRNPAEVVAIERLLRKASARQAHAVTNVKCAREIRIGLTWPTAVVCQADAIAFE